MNPLILVFATVSNSFNLPVNLLSAVCYVESGHKPNAIHLNDGGADSLGMCQIKLTTARQLGYTGTANELQVNYKINIFYAGKYLRYQLKRYKGDQRKAIAAYNAGSWSGKSINIKYLNKVLLAREKPSYGEN